MGAGAGYRVVEEIVPVDIATMSLIAASIAGLAVAVAIYSTGYVFIAALAAVMSLSIDAAVLAFVGLEGRERRRRIAFLREVVAGAGNGRIVFRRSISYRYGYIVMRGKWVSYGGRRQYSRYAEFEERGRGRGAEAVFPRGILSSYTVVLRGDGSGYMRLPAILIDEPVAEGAVVAIIPGGVSYAGGDIVLSVSHERGDYGYASLETRGSWLIGTITYTGKNASRSLRLELAAESPNGVRVRETLAALEEPGSKRIKYPLSPRETTIILLSGIKHASPLVVHHGYTRMLLKPPRLAGFGDGEYRVRLVLDIPMHRDRVAEKKLDIKPVTAET